MNTDASAPKREPLHPLEIAILAIGNGNYSAQQHGYALKLAAVCLDEIEDLRAVAGAARYLMSLGDEQDIVWFTAYEALRKVLAKADAALRGEPKEGM